ncbi:hypothetical protein Bbelb_187450 [Branchiostoma belcheri]|nr:hypothetical protein Bbelb_187450 [Branchiostoma belcheri]
MDTRARATRVANDLWGFESLREAQLTAITAVSEGKDTFVGLATGQGRSICYQILPSISTSPTVVLVISPLHALVADQSRKTWDVSAYDTAICDLKKVVAKICSINDEKASLALLEKILSYFVNLRCRAFAEGDSLMRYQEAKEYVAAVHDNKWYVGVVDDEDDGEYDVRFMGYRNAYASDQQMYAAAYAQQQMYPLVSGEVDINHEPHSQRPKLVWEPDLPRVQTQHASERQETTKWLKSALRKLKSICREPTIHTEPLGLERSRKATQQISCWCEICIKRALQKVIEAASNTKAREYYEGVRGFFLKNTTSFGIGLEVLKFVVTTQELD